MNLDLETHKHDVARALRGLDDAIERFSETLAHAPLWIRIDGARSEADARRRAIEAYTGIRYGLDDEPNQSPVCCGVIGASADAIARAQRVNDAKAELKLVCAPLQHRQMSVPRKGGEGGSEKLALVRVVLRAIQRSDLNLLAAYRKIPILGAPPESVTLTRASTRAVYRKSVDELFTLLATAEGPIASADRARLAALKPSETHLAFVKEHYENIRANIRYARLDARGRGRVQVAAELPLLYARGRHPTEPEIQFPDAGDPVAKKRKARPSKLEAEPLLQSLPVYRYRDR